MPSSGGNRQDCSRDRRGNGLSLPQRHRLIERAVKHQGRRGNRAEDRGRRQEVASTMLLAMLLDKDLWICLECNPQDGVDEGF